MSCAMDAAFRERFPVTSNLELARLYGVTPAVIATRAARLGLYKTAEHRREMQRANARKRRLTKEQREDLSRKARGRRQSPETVAKILRTKRERGSLSRGSRHWNWKGGRPWERYRDERYVRWRTDVLSRDGYRCRICGRQCRKSERGLAAHHIRPYAADIEGRYDIANGLTLCRSCHMRLHGHPLPPRKMVECACGCGVVIPERDDYGRQRRYVNHHHRRGMKLPEAAKSQLRAQRRGVPLKPDQRSRISQGLRSSARRIGRPPKAG